MDNLKNIEEIGLESSAISDNAFSELIVVDNNLCIDDSFVEEFILKMQRNESEKWKFQDIKSPYKTKGISLALKEIPRFAIQNLTMEYAKTEHPYILTELANCYVMAGEFIEALPLLYRSTKQIANYPTKYFP